MAQGPEFREFHAVRDGMRIYGRDYPGPEPALVLMHGFPDSLELYDLLLPHVVGKRRVVLFDFIGWGRSDQPAGDEYTFDNLTRDLDAVIAHLGLETPDLVAHDASGPPAIEWSLAHPHRVGDLVLLNTFYMMMLRLRPPEGVFLYMMPVLKYLTRVVNRLSGQRLNRVLYHWQLRRFVRDRATKTEFVPYLYGHWKGSWRAFEGLVGRLFFQSIRYARPENLDRLRAYPGHVRIIFGARDPYLNVHVARRLHKLFPSSELHLFDSAYHYVQADEPEAVARLLTEPGEPDTPDTDDRPPAGATQVEHRPVDGPRSPLAALRTRMFSVPYDEVRFAVRGFERCDTTVEARIEEYFDRFLDGYHLALRTPDLGELGQELDREIASEHVGFAYEGAGMYLALRDYLDPLDRGRLARFIAGPAVRHDFVTLIGIGLAAARLPWVRRDLRPTLRRLDPGLCWFAVDGYGFHEGFFRHRAVIEQAQRPRGLTGYAARCFDNGVGRALWFVKGADPERIGAAVERFEEPRRKDVWAGMGLACAYAGGVREDLDEYGAVIEKLRASCGPHEVELGLGMVFAAYARHRATTWSPWTSRACELLLGLSMEESAAIGARALESSRAATAGGIRRMVRETRYEAARQGIRDDVAARLGTDDGR
jgi:pimeloyl-ACP methyl ester carboxylesterase